MARNSREAAACRRCSLAEPMPRAGHQADAVGQRPIPALMHPAGRVWELTRRAPPCPRDLTGTAATGKARKGCAGPRSRRQGVNMERMSPLDAGFFFVEHANVPMHLGSLAVFEGPAPSHPELVNLFTAKLPHAPRYRQVVRTAPLQVLSPAWADDEDFEIGYHLRHAAVPRPGRARQLRGLAGQIYAQPLNRGRPLWEAWFLKGIEAGRWAILLKVHPCMVDGIAGADLMAEIFDLCPDAGPPEQPIAWEPQPRPALAGTLASGIRDAVSWPLRLPGGVAALARQRRPARADLVAFTRGLAGSARRLAVPSASCLTGPIGPYRQWVWTTASLSRVRGI